VNDKDGDMGDWAPTDARAYRASLAKRAAAVRAALRDCTIVGLQEVEGKDEVWAALAAGAGPGYRYDYYESADARDITVGILYRADRVELRSSSPQQACTATDYGVDYAAVRGPRGHANPCQPGSYPLFDRPPYVADVTVSTEDGTRRMDLRVSVNHFKSKTGDERENLPRRVAQAAFVAGLMAEPHAIALGDFNDSPGSDTLAQFAGLTNVLDRFVSGEDRYTYIYNGRADALDHFVMTRDLDPYFLGGRPLHINADYPDLRAPDASGTRSSDHDPIFVRFGFTDTGVSAALTGAVCGAAQPH
jgi:predicted extracellular nuclease